MLIMTLDRNDKDFDCRSKRGAPIKKCMMMTIKKHQNISKDIERIEQRWKWEIC